MGAAPPSPHGPPANQHAVSAWFIRRPEVAIDKSEKFVHYSLALPERCVPQTDERVWDMFDDLASRQPPVETKAEFEVSKQMLGISFHPECLPMDMQLRSVYKPVSSVFWDWMHVLVSSGGIMAYHCNEFLLSLKFDVGWEWHQMDAHLEMFLVSNQGQTGKLQAGFIGKRVHKTRSDHEHIRAYAGEVITLFAFLYYICKFIFLPSGRIVDECNTVILAHNILCMLRSGDAALGRIHELRAMFVQYHKALIRLYDISILKVKAHLQHHICDSAQRSNHLINCFNNERRNRLLIAAASHYFEAGSASSPASKAILARLLTDLQNRICKGNFTEFRLVCRGKPKPANYLSEFFPRRTSSIHTSNTIQFRARLVRKDDLVTLVAPNNQSVFAVVVSCAQVVFADTLAPEYFVLVCFLAQKPGDPQKYIRTEVIDFVDLQSVRDVYLKLVSRSGEIKPLSPI